MLAYVAKRCLYLISVLIILSIIVFSIVLLIPGDPAIALLGDTATPQMVEQLQQELGLNKSVFEQYVGWLGDVMKGNFGYSYHLKLPVLDIAMERLVPTLSIALFAIIIAIVIAIPLGILAASKPNTWLDFMARGFTLFGMTVPSFLLGLILMLVLAVTLKWLPVSGYKPLSEGLVEHLKYIFMPALALGLIQSALITKITRASMIDVLHESYIKTARAKGVLEGKIVYIHGLKNALLPIITVVGQSFGALVAGAAVVESIFNIPGIGQLLVISVGRRDYFVIQGVVLIIAIMTVLINLIVDLLYAAADPRVRLYGK